MDDIDISLINAYSRPLSATRENNKGGIALSDRSLDK